jgi:hypothetical protein
MAKAGDAGSKAVFSYVGGWGKEFSQKLGRPIKAADAEKCVGKVRRPMLGEQSVDQLLAFRIGCAAKCQGDRPQSQLEQPVAAGALQIILALGGRPRDQFDLADVETERLIGGPVLRFDGAVVGQEYPLRAAFNNGRGN